jgi:exoribonuclease-2
MKVFTIDSASTSEIDDGISLEKFKDSDGMERQRIWVHIADADRWAPRTSQVFDIARRRVTSLYLPQGAIPMLPPK